MASLDLKIEDFCDSVSMPAEPRTTPAPKTESENESFAYKDVGSTGYSDSKVTLILLDYLQPDTTKSLAFTVESILDLLPKNASCVKRGPDEENFAAWPNLHAFFVNGQDDHVRPPSPLFAIWAMREAFEYHPKGERKPFKGLQDQKVLAVAQHISWNGQGLFQQVMYPGDIPSDRVPVPSWNAGPLYKDKPALSLDRWQFWRKGFEASGQTTPLLGMPEHG